ncbi:MAG: dTDP-4-dehydrorhamnose 3,5-epimerase [Candidatus Dojkabacteria bacterium]|jgi:dTDP-4-dehydrorhamnose 3,5-epimerase|nr:dTDP-4-dehydrorhamnose 3,5-epimerase [Candidatus Dojkabacteria bacterium]
MEFEHNYGGIDGLVVITPVVFGDERGFFKETFNEEEFERNGINIHWIQDNHSRSSMGVLRGLHWQKGEYAQDKLVRVTTGSVLDVAVDIRKDSPTFGKYAMVELTEDNHKMFLLPRGFAHGFVALTDMVDFEYKVGGSTHNKESERAIIWNDPDIGIQWGIEDPLVSEKDGKAPQLKDIDPSDLF